MRALPLAGEPSRCKAARWRSRAEGVSKQNNLFLGAPLQPAPQEQADSPQLALVEDVIEGHHLSHIPATGAPEAEVGGGWSPSASVGGKVPAPEAEVGGLLRSRFAQPFALGSAIGAFPNLLRGSSHSLANNLLGPRRTEIDYRGALFNEPVGGIGFRDAAGERSDLLIPLATSLGAEDIADPEADDQSSLQLHVQTSAGNRTIVAYGGILPAAFRGSSIGRAPDC
jgi:hypothetical protein